MPSYVVAPALAYFDQAAAGGGSGTQSSPLNNLAGTLSVLPAFNTKLLFVLGTLSIDTTVTGFIFQSWGALLMTCSAASTSHVMTNSTFRDFKLTGEFDGSSPSAFTVERCHLDSVKACVEALDCRIGGTFTPKGHTILRNCDFAQSSADTANFVTVDLSAVTSLEIVNCRGRIKFTNASGTAKVVVAGGGGALDFASNTSWTSFLIAGDWRIVTKPASSSLQITDYSAGSRFDILRGQANAVHKSAAELTFTVSGAHTSDDTTIAVTSSTGVTVGDTLVCSTTGEVMTVVTAANPITVTRGAIGSVAQPIASGALLWQLLTLVEVNATLKTVSTTVTTISTNTSTIISTLSTMTSTLATISSNTSTIITNLGSLTTTVGGIVTSLSALTTAVATANTNISAVQLLLARVEDLTNAIVAALRVHSTTVASGISSGATSLTVAASGAVVAGYYAVNLSTGEVFSIDNVAGTTWTITRGQFATAAAAMSTSDVLVVFLDLSALTLAVESTVASIASDLTLLGSVPSLLILIQQAVLAAENLSRAIAFTRSAETAATHTIATTAIGVGVTSIELDSVTGLSVDDLLVNATTGEVVKVVSISAPNITVDREELGTVGTTVMPVGSFFWLLKFDTGLDAASIDAVVQQIVDLFVDDATTVVNVDDTRTVTIFEQDGTTVKNRVTISADGLNRTREV